MSDRIRDLEGGLQSVQARVSTEEHPLLRQDLLTIKKSPDLFGIERQAEEVLPKASASASPRAQSAASSYKVEDEVRGIYGADI